MSRNYAFRQCEGGAIRGLQAHDAPCYMGLKGFPLRQEFFGEEKLLETRQRTMQFVARRGGSWDGDLCMMTHSSIEKQADR